MAVDLSVDMIKATVQIEQPNPNGTRTVGTGFLLSDPTPDGRPRIVLVTAAHVFDTMPAAEARIGYRFQGADGGWRYSPQPFAIRSVKGKPNWTKHPTRDVAVMEVKAPPEFAKSAIPLNWLAGDDTFNRYGVEPGDEMEALGYPLGLAANQAGFPILRSGRVASYPLAPSAEFPTFLLDFAVFPGNSGGPVYIDQRNGKTDAAGQPQDGQFIAGILTQQVELSGDRLEIGIVTHARYIREAVEMLDGHAPAPVDLARAEPAVQGAVAASAEALGQPR
jgi:V8-like Glu-specific endopeptidase